MTKPLHTITVAAAQLPARPLEQAAQAQADIGQAVADARQAGADLVVLPECCYPAYWLGGKDRYRQADILRGQAVEAWFADLAREHGITIAAGLVVEQDDRLYDAAVLFDPAGNVRARHFKTFLWDSEHDWYTPGDQVRPAATDLGTIGLLVCAEGRSPEVFASHAAQGAGLLAMPTAWVNAAATPGEYYNPQPDFLVQARAMEFGLPIVCANKFGQECEQARFCGMSLIVAADGSVLAKAPADQAALLVAKVNVEPKRLLLPDATVRELLETPPVPPRADAPSLRVAVVSRAHATMQFDPTPVCEVPQGVNMAFCPAWPGQDQCVWPNKRDDAPLRHVAHAMVGYLTAGQARSFAVPRLLSLRGAQVLCITQPCESLPVLRVRAVENRVFVIAAVDNRRVVIAPSGAILADAPVNAPEPLLVDLDLTQAAAKLVAPQTHVWTERRCGAYCFIGG